MITISHVTKRFGRARAVDDAGLALAPGDAVALWGTNGAGKTTLIRCILGLIRFRGRITVGGFDSLRQGKRARQLIGYVPQEIGFHDDLRLAEAVAFYARLKGLGRVPAAPVLAEVGLSGHESKRIRELSGGMKQRLALALALLGDPPVLILDEVTASLDACGREEFIALLSRLIRAGSGAPTGAQPRRTLLFASHRVEEVARLATRVITLDKGRTTGETPAAEFAQRQAMAVAAPGVAIPTLHLHIAVGLREHAAAVLRRAGFTPSHNGVGLLVPVQGGRKAAPLRLLADARVEVDDFDLLGSAPTPAATEAHP
ncbi:MAG: ABC transporter ATP-binding protein [Phycisphaerales bacterium]